MPRRELIKVIKIKIIDIKYHKHFRCNKPIMNISQLHRINVNKYSTNSMSFTPIKTTLKHKRTYIMSFSL